MFLARHVHVKVGASLQSQDSFVVGLSLLEDKVSGQNIYGCVFADCVSRDG